MTGIFLQNIIEDIKFEDLPANWNSFDLEIFSRNKSLWDYQQQALKNAIKALWKYFENIVDYQENENLEISQERKQKFFQWYRNNGLEKNVDIKLDKRKRRIYNLLNEYYPQKDGKIPYGNFINRMCFWMATGSGKTLVIIKLIQILYELIKRREIPEYDILYLTHRDDLIEQLKNHVEEFNLTSETKINLKELREYPEVKRQRTFFDITVFYYRSDNLSDEQKEKIIDFKNYDNEGKWYIFLDEAHKGDKEESKRQHVYSILSRNGFLFNSSATFIDPRDIITTVFNFNLEKFINAGYGKHISILKQEIRAFREEDDYNDEEKQKIVLKSLIFLTYVKKFYEEIIKTDKRLYNKPLLLTLVNSVNIEDADLKRFFRELEKIGKGKVEKDVFYQAKDELLLELGEELPFMFEENGKVEIEDEIFKNITKGDILKYVYNSEKGGDIEILIRQSNRKELAFKLKTSDKPFSLVKIGDISEWLKNELAGYEVQERFEEESYFKNLNREDSEINILMGSRSFYEGWDSNRPNVINFINIGTGTDARKFILQSVGRGVRIEPIANKRKRILSLYNANEIGEELFNEIKDKVLPIETLFIFGTNRTALISVIKELEQEKKKEGESQLSLFVNQEAQKLKLLVPIYKQAPYPLVMSKKPINFEISKEELDILDKFLQYVADDRVLLMKYRSDPIKTKLLRDSLYKRKNFRFGDKSYKNVDLLTQRIFDYFSVFPEEFENFKELEEEIRHFKNIKVYFTDISEMENKIEKVKNYKDYEERKKDLEKKFRQGKTSFEELEKKIKETSLSEEYEHDHKKIDIKYVAHHYYIPLILSEDEKINYISHIIKSQSEVKFVNDLGKYLAEEDNRFKEFDWWLFSKLDETLDKIFIPYYNPNINKISNFFPDFIFWMKKGNNYFILFVDPKGTEHASAYRKIDGYKNLFEENGKEKWFNYNGLKVKIKLLLRPEDTARTLAEYRKYWFDNIENMVEGLETN